MALTFFVNQSELRDSSCEEPTLKNFAREDLIRQLLPESDLETDIENRDINESEQVFEQYIQYVDELWQPWACARREDIEAAGPAPELPSVLKPWIASDQIENFEQDEPAIQEKISVEVDRVFEEAKQLLTQGWQGYLENKWKPWAQADRPLQIIQKIYNQLYTTYQRAQRLGEQFEVVLGFGLLNWKTDQSHNVKRHVLVCDMSLSFNAGVGQVFVSGNPNGLQLRAETDMLEVEDRPPPKEITSIEDEIKDIKNDIWDEAFLKNILNAFVNSLPDDRGQFEWSMTSSPAIENTPRIDLAPALILRRRSQRGYVRLLSEIANQIKNSSTVPQGVLEIFDAEAVENHPGPCEGDQSELSDVQDSRLRDHETYFPLPANKEQQTIADRLEHGSGVLVQGPPGTGKTHTITNLVCHLLAQGKRVLITSETPRALESLRSKFSGSAAPLADLCVLLLGNDSGSIEALEKSVKSINTKLATFESNVATREVSRLRQALLETRTNKSKAEQALKAIREQDTFKHNKLFNRYSGTLEEISSAIRKESECFGWLLDKIPEGLKAADIFSCDTDNFVKQWSGFNVQPDMENVFSEIKMDNLLAPEEFSKLVEDLSAQELIVSEAKGSANAQVSLAIVSCDREQISNLQDEVNSILANVRLLNKHALPWAVKAAKDVMSEHESRWSELLEVSKTELLRCEMLIRDISLSEVMGVEDSELRKLLAHTEALMHHIADKGQFKGKYFGPKPVREAFKSISEVKLDGLEIEDEASLTKFQNWLICNDALLNLKRNWGELARSIGGELNLQLAEFRDHIDTLETAVSLHDRVVNAQKIIDSIALFEAPDWTDVLDIECFANGLNLQTELDKFEALKIRFSSTNAVVVSALNENEEFRAEFIEAFLEKDPDCYSATFDRITEYNQHARCMNELCEAAQSFSKQLPKTFKAFLTDSGVETWSQRLLNLSSAMDWRRARDYVKACCSPGATENISKKISELDSEEHELLGRLAAELAWKHCLGRLNNTQRRSMVAWMQEIKKIGKGTGKYTERRRTTARAELRNCQGAIPAWVMPMHRVVESVSATPGQFDVAIIDEASQSGPEALILNYIAKKVVVVGDDKQIRPQNVGINRKQVESFRQRHLSDVEHSQSFDMDSSYFSQAEIRFQNQIRLKEHFRCMPEIILFSNNHFYNSDPLIPLRQFGGSRLTPVVKAEYVKGGFVQGSLMSRINEPEARRVVEIIAECCEDPAYEDKTMGVICLMGGQQDRLIQKLLIEEIEAEEIEARNLLVGRPYAFQGDERDVIFLSMVNAPIEGNRCRIVSSQAKEREFNVAASRARDQLVLVHSATANDLSPNCLQYKLLDHCTNPRIEQDDIDGNTINDIRVAARGERVVGQQPKPFDSWFEVDVFLSIVNKGYRVVPQYHANPFERSYRIDMVVEGIHGRLAVECDGDHWHGPEQYDNDMARQRELERAGWRFWRLRGSEFNFDPESAMMPLWEILERHCIYPVGFEPKEHSPTIDSGTLSEDQANGNDVSSHQSETKKTSNAQLSSNKIASIEREKRSHNKVHSPKDLQHAIIKVLENRPNNTIALKSMTKEVLSNLGIRTRGQPRADLDKRIRRSVGILKRKGAVKEYRAKNVRIRLVKIMEG